MKLSDATPWDLQFSWHLCHTHDILTFLGKPMQDFIRRRIYSYHFRKDHSDCNTEDWLRRERKRRPREDIKELQNWVSNEKNSRALKRKYAIKFSAQFGKRIRTWVRKIVKNWKGLEILPYLRISSLTCHSFMDAESRHKSSGSETKESLVFIAVAEARVSAFLFQRPEPSCPQGDREKEQMIPNIQPITWLKKDPLFREPEIFSGALSMLISFSGERHYTSLLRL